MIDVKHSGDFKNLERFLKRMSNKDYQDLFDRAADVGLKALISNTPKDTGKTAASWSSSVSITPGASATISYHNHNVTESGTPIVILIQYGYSTKQGVYIQGREFINESITPVFDKLLNDIWKEVTAK